MSELDINKFLEELESNYNTFDSFFYFDTNDVLNIDKEYLDSCIIPEVNIPLTAIEYLSLRKT
jgi:hypothetical protein